MKYMGSKARIAKHILPIILKDRKEGQWYVEPFVGGANIFDKVAAPKLGNDANIYLISMWLGLCNGWTPPKEISKELYNSCRTIFNKYKFNALDLDKEEKALIGYVGFNGSYGGRFYDGGYAGVVTTKNGKVRNYPLEAYNNTISQIPNLVESDWLSVSYEELNLSSGTSVVYCDPPYKGTKEYTSASTSGFNTEAFWDICRKWVSQGNKVFISEYNAPDDFVCVWEQEVKSSLSANGKIGGSKSSVERLFIHKSQYNEENL